ncbi:hypothetical protein DSO57_1005418 [Entomophthora muscae]|uniref:Uncharacterized protein n=1 Tax=Entomophthora muscae TaxID=34485 RepID=A0ACC2TVM8_9FUNG|nr:hypothetical protein DSO57_1005418 [Entomophthora muscae]
MDTSVGSENRHVFKVNPLHNLKSDLNFLFSLQNPALSPVWKIWLGKVYRPPMPQWTLDMFNRYIKTLKDEPILLTPRDAEISHASPGYSSKRPIQTPSQSFENSPTIRPESEQEIAQDDSSQDGSSIVEPSYSMFDSGDTKPVNEEPLLIEEPVFFNDRNGERETPNFVYFRSSLDNYIAQHPYINNPQSL